LPEQAGGPHDILWNEQGPLWYRGTAQNDEATESANVAAVLARYQVRHVVLGHTKQYRMINARFDGAVVLTDIAVTSRCADPNAFLIKEGDTWTVSHRGKRLELGASGAAHESYLSEIAALDQATQCGAN
jgi:hypothetical protein